MFDLLGGRRGRGRRAGPPGPLDRRSGTTSSACSTRRRSSASTSRAIRSGGVWDRAQRLGVVGTGQLAQVEDGARVLLCGLVVGAPRDQHEERQPHGLRDLEDIEGTIEVTIFPELFRQSVAHLRSGATAAGPREGRGTATGRGSSSPTRSGRSPAEDGGAAGASRRCRALPRGRPLGRGRGSAPGAPGDLRGAPRDRAPGASPPRGRRQRSTFAPGPCASARRRPSSRPWRGSWVRERHRRGLTGRPRWPRTADLEKALDFERPLLELETRIETLRRSGRPGTDARGESRLEERLQRLQRKVFAKLTAWQRVQLARHPRAAVHAGPDPPPHSRTSSSSTAIASSATTRHRRRAGPPRGRPIVVVGHQKGRDTRGEAPPQLRHAAPRGYRKALRLMQLAERFRKPILTLIDTPGAYPGIGAEERGQAEAIARNLREMAGLPTPIVARGDRRGGQRRRAGARRRRPRPHARARDLLGHLARGLRRHPLGGREPRQGRRRGPSHHGARPAEARRDRRDHPGAPRRRPPELGRPPRGRSRAWSPRALAELVPLSPGELVQQRYAKFRRMGIFEET